MKYLITYTREFTMDLHAPDLKAVAAQVKEFEKRNADVKMRVLSVYVETHRDLKPKPPAPAAPRRVA